MRCKGTAFFCICKTFRQKITLFLAFFLKITAFSYFFTLIVISTLQNDKLNRGYWLLLYVLPYLCTFAARKIIFAAVFYNVVGARTLYIGKSIKPHYLPFAAVFRLICMFALSFVFGTFAAAFCCRFLFRLILNRKLFGNFEFFSTFA